MTTEPALTHLDPARCASGALSAGESGFCAARHRVFFGLLHGAVLALCNIPAFADEVFTAPRAYPVARYEAGWNKNPFTLKTAPVAVQQKSFAENLVIASYYGSKDNPTVVIADKTTRERTSLRLNQPGEKGMELKAISIQPARKDTTATIALAGQIATVRFDNSFITQMVAQGGTVAQPVPGQPGQAQIPGLSVPNIMNDAAARSRQAQGIANTPKIAPGASGVPAPVQPQISIPMPGAVPQPGTSAAALENAGNVPTPVRRRLLTAPVAPPPTPVVQP